MIWTKIYGVLEFIKLVNGLPKILYSQWRKYDIIERFLFLPNKV
jgi:hypothetical protein